MSAFAVKLPISAGIFAGFSGLVTVAAFVARRRETCYHL